MKKVVSSVCVLCLACALLLGIGASASANLLQNGGFESGNYVDAGSGFMTLVPGNTDLSGWTVLGDSIDWIGPYWQSSEGDHSLDLNGLGTGGIMQSFSTTTGVTYRVSFDLAGNPVLGPAQKIMASVLVGNDPVNYEFDTTGKSVSNMGWTTKSFDFTAGIGGSSMLIFASQVDGPCGPALDNVRVEQVVPEPSTLVMCITGVGSLLGMAMRRRRSA